MKAWQNLLQVAITGTDRRGIPADLREQLAKLPLDEDRPAPDWLLEAATWLQSAGRAQPLSEPSAPAPGIPLPEDDLRPTAAIGRELELILDGPHRRALPELLDRLKEGKAAMPREHLPALLDLVAKDPEMKPMAETVWGPTGRWLQQQNPEWGEPETPQLFEVLDLRKLVNVRRREPEAVFRWARENWPNWKAAEKAKALQALKPVSPSPEEHHFLENCLEERSQKIRELATQILLQDPETSLSRELWEFLKPHFSFSERGNKKELHVDLPGMEEMSSRRFFFKPQGNRSIREDLFGRMLSFVPPERWEERFGLTSEGVIELFFTSSKVETYLPHLMRIGTRFSSSAWCAQLLRRGIDRPKLWHEFKPEELIRELAPGHWAELAAHALRKPEGFFDENSPAVQLLRHARHPWSESISLAFFRKVIDWITQPSATPWNSWLYQTLLLEVAAYRIPVGSAGRLQALLPADQTPWSWREPLDRFYATLLFRAQLRHKIRKAVT